MNSDLERLHILAKEGDGEACEELRREAVRHGDPMLLRECLTLWLKRESRNILLRSLIEIGSPQSYLFRLKLALEQKIQDWGLGTKVLSASLSEKSVTGQIDESPDRTLFGAGEISSSANLPRLMPTALIDFSYQWVDLVGSVECVTVSVQSVFWRNMGKIEI